jgi:hypothetical protein
MARTLGSSGSIKVDTAAGTTYVALAKVKNASFSLSADEVDVTDNDSSGGWREFLMGNRAATFSFTANAEAVYAVDASSGDTEQKAIVDELLGNYGGTAFKWQYFPHGTTNDYYRYTFSGYVQEVSHDMSNNEVVEINVTIRVTSSVVVATAQAIAT